MAKASRKIVFWEVDAQKDFMLPGGKLYVAGAEKIIPNIERLVDAARQGRVFLVSSGCAHTADDPEFKMFPPHCIRGTDGARIVAEGLTTDYRTIANDALARVPADLFSHAQVVIEKQVLDVFSNPHTSEIVEGLGSEAEFVVFGVVTEYCVHFAAKGLLDRGRKVFVVTDAIETLKAQDSEHTMQELKAMGAQFVTTDEALQMVSGGGSATARRQTQN
ncbi:MAG: isochorismatase family cysteine hydrolase [Candidatus Acidiferrales bacterium]